MSAKQTWPVFKTPALPVEGDPARDWVGMAGATELTERKRTIGLGPSPAGRQSPLSHRAAAAAFSSSVKSSAAEFGVKRSSSSGR